MLNFIMLLKFEILKQNYKQNRRIFATISLYYKLSSFCYYTCACVLYENTLVVNADDDDVIYSNWIISN